jgi:hypothetical protein
MRQTDHRGLISFPFFERMAYKAASKRTAGAALAGLIASILSSGEHTTTGAAVRVW